jgi:predicted GNAT family acetyltransferase
MTNYSESDVIHDKDQKVFYIQIKGGNFKTTKKAFLQYEIEDSGYDLWHTEVPEECRGQGIAGILASKAISELAQTQWADCNIF